MSAETFDTREANDVACFAAEGLFAVVNQAGLFDEVVHRKGRREAGRHPWERSRHGRRIDGTATAAEKPIVA